MFEEIVFAYPGERERLWKRLEGRSRLFDRALIKDVQDIFSDVQTRGDQAVKKATKRFDRVEIPRISIDESYADKCIQGLTPELRSAIDNAIENIGQVNRAMMPEPFWQKEIRTGAIVGEKCTPLSCVGLWVPARKGPLVSSALMLTVAAKVAGVGRIIVGMPPTSEGLCDPATVAAARLAGADGFVVGNGVAIIAAMAIGTESVPESDGIFGPGPNAIAAAMSTAFSYGKRTVVGIGPTEGAIIADDSADPLTIAYDMISESEHGPDSSFVLVTPSESLAARVREQLGVVIHEVQEPRKTNLLSVFGDSGFGAIVITGDVKETCEVINEYAPEHLMIWCNPENEKVALDEVKNTGEILVGPYTTFSSANYMIGITAVLPTNGFAKRFSGVTCKDMLKFSSFGRLDKEAMEDMFAAIKAIGEYEGLPCHVKAVEVRVKKEYL
ncbi:MAG: histidinol dehydrogenase [Deltaproteobacteria bacterium]|nr:histidinol dehydrogenase [Deltaproteobacteria bacterium]